jgi:hypothetical protein
MSRLKCAPAFLFLLFLVLLGATGNSSAQTWISGANVSTTANAANITWNTAVPSDSQVEYGPTAAYGSVTPIAAARVTAHSVAITGLSAGLTYHCRVRSRDSDGVLTIGLDHIIPALPVSISISPSSATTTSGVTQQFTASVRNSTNTAVTWSASAGTISSSGLFTSPTVASPTSVIVTATSQSDPAKSASATVTVNPAAPTVTSITPNTGTANGGTQVVITGTGFSAGATVSLGGVAATNVVVSKSTSITATAPAHAAGTVGVVVTNSDGQNWILSGGYTYTSSGGGGSGIGFVQVKSATVLSGSSVAVTYPVAQTAGNLNVVAVMWGDTTSTVKSVTDSQGNLYALAIGPTKITGVSQSIYYAKNIVAGSNTVTATFNQAAAYPNVNVLEYSGPSTTSPLDVVASASCSGTTANSGVAATTSANELIFGTGSTSNVATGAGSGFSNRIINSFGDISEDRIVSSTGSYNATATMTSGSWVMQMVAFRASGQSPATNSASTVTSNTAPVLSVSPTSLSFAGQAGSSSLTPASVSITNTGTGTLTFTAVSDQPWLVLSAASGTVPSTLGVGPSIGGLKAGTYLGHVTLTGGGATSVVTVSLNVTAVPVQHVVSLSWKASTDLKVVSYSAYRSTTPGGSYGLLASALGTPAYSDQTVQSGSMYYYVVTAVDDMGKESAFSNEAQVTIP